MPASRVSPGASRSSSTCTRAGAGRSIRRSCGSGPTAAGSPSSRRPACRPGRSFTEEETRALADAALANDAIVVFDAHADHLAFGGRRVTQPAALPGFRERTLTGGCLSKCWNKPGWRAGGTLGPRELVGALEDTHIFNGIILSGFAQVGAAAALADPQEWQRESVAYYERNAELLVRELEASPHLRVVPPEGGSYFLASVEAIGVHAFALAERLAAG